MKHLSIKLSLLLISAVFASMQVYADGLSNATINSTQGGYAGMQNGVNSATLNFTGNSHIDWNQLNLNSNETLNFNAINGASGLTVLNTVSGGQMSSIYGTINSNEGIQKLIISNPSGMLFDGTHFNTTGDVMLTTQQMTPVMSGAVMTGVAGTGVEAATGIRVDGCEVNVGGEFSIAAPNINVINAVIKADRGFKLVTRDGQSFLVSTNNGTVNKGVRLESVSVDGDVYILAGKDYTKVVNGGHVAGDMTVDSQGIVSLNYTNNGNKFKVDGDLIVDSTGALNPMRDASDYVGAGNFMYIKEAEIGGDMSMSNSGGFLEAENIKVVGNADLTTTTGANTHVKHFTHVVGDNEIGGNLNINSVNNIHIGNYDIDSNTLLPGSLKVGGDLNATADYGHIMITIDTQADKMNLTSNQLNVLTDENAVLKANEYQFTSNGYIGGIGTYVNDSGNTINGTDRIISLMENYTYIPKDIKAHKYMNIAGGDVTKIATKPDAEVYIKSNGDVTVDNVTAGTLNITAVSPTDVLGGNIELKDNVKPCIVKVGGETKLLTVPLESRDYVLKYTNIKDTQEITINSDTEITYDMLENNPNGYNFGTQTAMNTRIKAPANPNPTPDPTTPTYNPQDNDNVKILNNLNRDGMTQAVDAGSVYTPIAFAADLDDEIETGVRKNVDGSVTVVRPFTPANNKKKYQSED